jgi:ABC-type nitrate/sulfonate/bicarbonate transport system substrate-binding protein/outer membrane protein OmpA-like peptidoglycan-associated protein
MIIAIVIGCVVGVSHLVPRKDNSDDTAMNVVETSKTPTVKNENKKPTEAVNKKTDVEDMTINLSLDEWIGWEPILYANKGLTTQPGSVFDKLGIKVNIHVINDADASSNALIKGDLNAAGYTLNRTAFLSGKFADAGLDIVMPVFTNYSDGGDGIIAMSNITSIEDLVDAKIGVPKFSEAQSMVVWFINNSDLSSDQKKTVIDNLILLDDAEQTGQAFFAGSLDVAATWQPYLSYAEDSTDSHILFDTTFSNKLILDGIVFRADFAKAHSDVVNKFIDGIFMALEEYESDFDTIRNVMPMFAGMSDEEIAATRMDAGMMDYAANVKALENDCTIIYSDMCDVWESIGETVDRSLGETLFDTSYVKALSDKYSSVTTTVTKTVEITEEQRTEALDIPSMLTKTCSIEFHPDTAKFKDNAEAAAILDEFVEMAKVLDGTIIQIEGNLNFDGALYSGDALSTSRANTVKKYFIANGIDASRIIAVGNGNSKMVVDPAGSVEDTMPNRRTDIFFKTVGA